MTTQIILLHDKNQVTCSVDVSQPLQTIIKTLCLEQFNIQEPAALFALRLVDTEELITEEVSDDGLKVYKNVNVDQSN